MAEAARALFRMGDTLRQGISGIGEAKRRDAEMGLARSKMEYDIGRQKTQDARQAEIDALQRPGLELASQKSRDQAAAYNATVTHQGMFGDLGLHAAESGADDAIAEYLGAAWAPGGQLVGQDGKPITQGMLEQSGKMQGVSDIIFARMDALAAQEDMLEGMKERLASGTVNPDQEVALKQEVAFLEKLVGDKDQQYKLLDMQRQAALRIGDKASALRIEGLMSSYTKNKAELAKEQRGYENARALERMRQAGANTRAGMRQKQQAGTWQTKSGEALTPDQAFERYKVALENMGLDQDAVSFDDWAADQGMAFVPSGAQQRPVVQYAPQPGSGGGNTMGYAMGALGAMAGMNQGGSSKQQPRQHAQPPVPGARQAKDGKWYVQKDGQWFEVVAGSSPAQQVDVPRPKPVSQSGAALQRGLRRG